MPNPSRVQRTLNELPLSERIAGPEQSYGSLFTLQCKANIRVLSRET
jgi:hypothetical protein